MNGIDQHLTLPSPLDINLYTADPVLMRGLEQLPGSLQEAVQIAQESDLVRKYVPGTCLRAYTRRTSR